MFSNWNHVVSKGCKNMWLLPKVTNFINMDIFIFCGYKIFYWQMSDYEKYKYQQQICMSVSIRNRLKPSVLPTLVPIFGTISNWAVIESCAVVEIRLKRGYLLSVWSMARGQSLFHVVLSQASTSCSSGLVMIWQWTHQRKIIALEIIMLETKLSAILWPRN